jgi:hypothetical protein
MFQLVYAIHQVPLHFKQEVSQWIRSQAYIPMHVAEKVWCKRIPEPSQLAVKPLLQYFKEIQEVKLKDFSSSTEGSTVQLNQLCGFVDSDWTGCEDIKSTSGYVISLNFSGNWSENSVNGCYSAKHIDLQQHLVYETEQAKTFQLDVVASVRVIDSVPKPRPQALFLMTRKRFLGL